MVDHAPVLAEVLIEQCENARHGSPTLSRCSRSALWLVRCGFDPPVLVVGTGCTPEQFQRWWTGRGNAPMTEPELSEAAAGATRFWAEVSRSNRFTATVEPIDGALVARMTPTSWRPGCPVPLRDLRHVRVSHMDFADSERTGELVVHSDSVATVLAAFEYLWDESFPIASMRLVDDFGGINEASMDANNTSAFNCRRIAGSARLSQHSYGRAIDINPVQNPYVAGQVILPRAGAAYLERARVRPGTLVAGSAPVRVFEFLGWGWGGRWSNSKDYQHVSANGR